MRVKQASLNYLIRCKYLISSPPSRKDVRLPANLQRAMAAEAEAFREAKAKEIAADGEKNAATALKEASDMMMMSPCAIQLRYLQVRSRLKNYIYVIF